MVTILHGHSAQWGVVFVGLAHIFSTNAAEKCAAKCGCPSLPSHIKTKLIKIFPYNEAPAYIKKIAPMLPFNLWKKDNIKQSVSK